MPLGQSTANLLTRWWRNRKLIHTQAHAQPCVSLALQGGGAHGAFTWGVLDALLQDPRLDFEAISGSSAGAMNAVVMAHGWMNGGREGARLALSDFWSEVGKQIPASMVSHGNGDAISLSPATKLLASWAGMFSPGNLNPLSINPLRSLLQKQIDFEALRKNSPFKLFIGATQANTGMLRLFRDHELTLDMLLASACLPRIHPTVEIDGQPYWDGGFAANPAVFPLLHEAQTSDVLLVLLAPRQHKDTPQTPDEIDDRMRELGFTTHFLREMQMFARTAALAANSHQPPGGLERRLLAMRFHMIDTELAVMRRSETKLLAHTPFLEMLRDQGREQGARWLAHNADAVGERGTVDLAQWLA
jgi:NTE family protein